MADKKTLTKFQSICHNKNNPTQFKMVMNDDVYSTMICSCLVDIFIPIKL